MWQIEFGTLYKQRRYIIKLLVFFCFSWLSIEFGRRFCSKWSYLSLLSCFSSTNTVYSTSCLL